MPDAKGNPLEDRSSIGEMGLTFAGDPRLMGAVRGFVRRLCRVAGFEPSSCHAITLAVDEACTNIIKHSYNNDFSGRIEMKIALLERGIGIELIDYGEKVDPSTVEPRKLDEPRPGGLGVFFIRKIMDEVEFDVSNRSFTRLRLVKYLPRAEENNECER